MIVRILTEGQWDVPDEHVDALNEIDSSVERAVDTADEGAFRDGLTRLLDAVRRAGERVPDDSLRDSDLILPPADATVEEVRELLGEDGLIPG